MMIRGCDGGAVLSRIPDTVCPVRFALMDPFVFISHCVVVTSPMKPMVVGVPMHADARRVHEKMSAPHRHYCRVFLGVLVAHVVLCVAVPPPHLGHPPSVLGLYA